MIKRLTVQNICQDSLDVSYTGLEKNIPHVAVELLNIPYHVCILHIVFIFTVYWRKQGKIASSEIDYFYF